MRRLALICGMLLTLTAGVWSSALAAASEWCTHEASTTVDAPDEHDCCRAKIGDAGAQNTAPHDASHDASHETPTARSQADESHAGMNCDGADRSPARESRAAAPGERGLSCAECCAGGSGQTPAPTVVAAPEQNKFKRDAGNASAGARDLFAPAPARVSHLAPTQHAPPPSLGRRHILISVFLI